MSILCIFRSDRPRLWYADLGTLLHPNAEPQEREYPLGWERTVLLGSSRGFLCVANVADGQVALWSPTTGAYNLLPRPADARIALLGPTACVYGFGYDDLREEHVLLKVVQTLGNPIVSAVSIYRSRANAWRWLERILPYYLIKPGRVGVYAHDRLHWIMRRQQNCMSAKALVAFELDTNRFVEVLMPNDIDRRRRMDLTLLGNNLCVIVYGEPGVVDVWIVGEHDWTLLFSLHHWCSFRTVRPLTFSRDHERVSVERVLMEVGSETKTLILYNINTGQTEPFHINGMPSFFDAATRLVQPPR